jgi:hypothetical protein
MCKQSLYLCCYRAEQHSSGRARLRTRARHLTAITIECIVHQCHNNMPRMRMTHLLHQSVGSCQCAGRCTTQLTGTRTPVARVTTSPPTRSLDGTRVGTPSRMTVQSGGINESKPLRIWVVLDVLHNQIQSSVHSALEGISALKELQRGNESRPSRPREEREQTLPVVASVVH